MFIFITLCEWGEYNTSIVIYILGEKSMIIYKDLKSQF